MKTADKCGVDVKIGRSTQRICSGFRKSVIPTACSFLPNQENNILPGDGETATGNRLKRGVLSTRQSSCLERYMFATASETAKGLRLDEPSMTPIMRDQGKMMSIGNTMDRYRGAVRDEVAETTFARFALSHCENAGYTSLLTVDVPADHDAGRSTLEVSLREERDTAAWSAGHVDPVLRGAVGGHLTAVA